MVNSGFITNTTDIADLTLTLFVTCSIHSRLTLTLTLTLTCSWSVRVANYSQVSNVCDVGGNFSQTRKLFLGDGQPAMVGGQSESSIIQGVNNPILIVMWLGFFHINPNPNSRITEPSDYRYITQPATESRCYKVTAESSQSISRRHSYWSLNNDWRRYQPTDCTVACRVGEQGHTLSHNTSLTSTPLRNMLKYTDQKGETS